MRRVIYILFISLAVAGSGCGSKKSGSGSDGGSNYTGGNVPPLTNPITNPTTGGSAVDLVINKAALDSYVGWTTNAPTNAKIGINLYKIATYAKTGGGFDYSFGGLVSIQFKDGTSNYSDEFRSDSFGDGNCGQYGDCNTVSGNGQNHKYNLFSSDYPELGGSVGFHGFFEDTRVQRLAYGYQQMGGAVILVIDSTVDLGDGAGPTSANGSIWFKNYFQNTSMGPIPLTHCWFISAGPYDCRSWKSGDGVNTKASMYPNNGYVKLGTFTNLEIKKAFNNEI